MQRRYKVGPYKFDASNLIYPEDNQEFRPNRSWRDKSTLFGIKNRCDIVKASDNDGDEAVLKINRHDTHLPKPPGCPYSRRNHLEAIKEVGGLDFSGLVAPVEVIDSPISLAVSDEIVSRKRIVDYRERDEDSPIRSDRRLVEVYEREISWPQASDYFNTPVEDVSRALNIVEDVLGGLSALHDIGVVHQDIKPHNVFVNPDAEDAYLFDLNDVVWPYTHKGHPKQDDYFRFPHEFEEGQVDKRFDVWRAGISLAEFIYDLSDFNSLDELHEEVEEDTDRVPEDVDEIILTSTAEDPDERYDDGAEMLEEVETAL